MTDSRHRPSFRVPKRAGSDRVRLLARQARTTSLLPQTRFGDRRPAADASTITAIEPTSTTSRDAGLHAARRPGAPPRGRRRTRVHRASFRGRSSGRMRSAAQNRAERRTKTRSTSASARISSALSTTPWLSRLSMTSRREESDCVDDPRDGARPWRRRLHTSRGRRAGTALRGLDGCLGAAAVSSREPSSGPLCVSLRLSPAAGRSCTPATAR